MCVYVQYTLIQLQSKACLSIVRTCKFLMERPQQTPSKESNPIPSYCESMMLTTEPPASPKPIFPKTLNDFRPVLMPH